MEVHQLKLRLIPFKLSTLVDELQKIYSHTIEERGLKFEIEITASVPNNLIGDPLRIKQVVCNLIANSIKFTSKGHIKLNISGEQIDIDNIYFTCLVEDTGIGIALKDQESVFHAFFSTSNSIDLGGTGLGLSICKNLISLMGGSIYFKSTPGQGTTFWFRIALPIVLEEKQSSVIELVTDTLINPTRVLVVDDCPVNLKVMLYNLRQLGYAVDIAYDGEEALTMLEKNLYDLVFMDIQMPVMNGLEATRELRKKGIGIPVVAMSAGTMEEEQRACHEAGMNDFISKPINRREIAEVFKKNLKQ